MQQQASWRYWLLFGVIGISALTPAWSQQPTSPTAPAAGADAKSYVEFGMANATKGDMVAAVGAFNEAIKIDPKFVPAYYYLGRAHASQNKSEEAIADFGQAIQLDPKYENAYYWRGILKGQGGDFDGAISDFSEVNKLNPKYAPAFYNLGHALYFKGNLDGALDKIEQALRLDPTFPYSYFIRGLIRHAQGHRAEATSDFQKSLGLGYPDAAFWGWITETEGGLHGLARKDLSDALGKPDLFKTDDWSSQIGNFLLGKINQDQLMAKAKTSEDAESGKRLCEAWFYCGVSKHLSGDNKGAQDCFAKAVDTGSKGSEEYIEAAREAAALQTP